MTGRGGARGGASWTSHARICPQIIGRVGRKNAVSGLECWGVFAAHMIKSQRVRLCFCFDGKGLTCTNFWISQSLTSSQN